MSDHRGRNGFALGLTVGLVGALLAGLALETYPSEQTQPDPTANEDQQIEPREGHWWIVRHLVYMDDSAAQWLMTLLTLAAVVLIYQTLRDTRQMIIDTRKIGEAQVRAYLAVDAIQVLGVDEGQRLTIQAVLKNTGLSPAKILRLKATAGLTRGDPHTAQWPKRYTGEASVSVIGGGGGAKWIKRTLPIPLTAQDVADIRDGNLRIFLSGAVVYRDVFGRTCGLLFRSGSAPGGLPADNSLDVSAKGNHSR